LSLCCCLISMPFFFFLVVKSIKLRGLTLARQMLYRMSLVPQPFALVYFSDRVSCFFLSHPWMVILLSLSTE
jgi:hypothetical protein